MCGSGTVLATAVQRGHHAVGVDIDPLAVMMSKLAVTAVATSDLNHNAAKVLRAAETSQGASPWGDDEETETFVHYWFGLKQRKDLIALMSAIDELQDDDVKLALRVAVSRIIVTKSPQASLAADAAHSRPHRVMTTSDYDVLDGFRRSAHQLGGLLGKRKLTGTGVVAMGDARSLSTVEDCSVDIAVTSPPYLNALDYLRGHKLALVWLGFTIGELRQRRSISIGSERRLDGKCTEIVSEIVDLIEGQAADPSVLRRPMIERFADDCVRFASELHRTVRPGGKVVLVVGNSTLRGNYIRNDLVVRRAMENCRFTFVEAKEREIPPSSRYMAIDTTATSMISRRMRKEVVLTMVR